MIFPNKTNNTITIRATAAVAGIIEKMIDANDKPRAEIVIDVRSSRSAATVHGCSASTWQLHHERRLFAGDGPARDRWNRCRRGQQLRPAAVQPEHHHARGLSADFYLAVPSAVAHFLETDSERS